MLAILLALPFAAFAARTTTVLPLEASGFADMEAVTNIALVVDHSRLDSMRFVVELDGSATNGVEVALGADSNQDGALSQNVPYPNWSSGQLVWKIPIGWKRMMYEGDDIGSAEEADYALYGGQGSRPLLIGNREDAYTQTFKILPSGESSVEKFRYRLTRSRWSFSGEVINVQ